LIAGNTTDQLNKPDTFNLAPLIALNPARRRAMWTLEKFQKLSELVAALAVVGSLAIVAYEVRQNTTAIQSAAAQAVNENFANWYTAVQGDRELLALSMKGMKGYQGLEALDKAQFIALHMPLLLNSQNAFYHWRDGS
jgi:hypothetical protein